VLDLILYAAGWSDLGYQMETFAVDWIQGGNDYASQVITTMNDDSVVIAATDHDATAQYNLILGGAMGTPVSGGFGAILQGGPASGGCTGDLSPENLQGIASIQAVITNLNLAGNEGLGNTILSEAQGICDLNPQNTFAQGAVGATAFQIENGDPAYFQPYLPYGT